MHISDSEKMEASVLGYRLNEKTEHLPIKKRRFLFRDSSPPPNTASSQGTASVAEFPESSSQQIPTKPDVNCPPVASSTVSDLHHKSSIDSKVDEEKLINTSKKASENEDICGTSLSNQAACSNNLVSHDMKNLEPGGIVEYKENCVKLENMSVKETDFHISTAHSKDVDPSTMDHSCLEKATVDEPTLDNSCSNVPSEITSKTQNSADLDDRLNWDLNTVMTAWEEPLECEEKTSNPKDCEQEIKYKIATKHIENEVLPVDMKSLTPKIEESELEECKPNIKLLSPVIYNTHVAVNTFKSLQNQHIDSSTDSAPVSSTLALKNPMCEISTKHVNVNNKGTDDLSHPMTAGTGFSLDYNILPSFDPCINKRASEENVNSSKIVGNRAISTSTVQTTENDKLNLSLVTAGSLENGVTFDEDDKSKVKRVITYSRITMENLIGKKSENSQNVFSSKFVENGMPTVRTTENEKLNLSLVTAASTEIGVNQSGNTFDEDDKAKVKRVITTNQTENFQDNHKHDCKKVNQTKIDAENKDQTGAVSSKHDVVCSDADVAIKAGKSPINELKFPNNLVNYNKEFYENENFPSDIQAGSEVDNVYEPSFEYDSQFEDGELRESSIQTWEGNEEENKEIKNNKENKVSLITHENESISAPESSSRIKSTEIGSQKVTDEISSVLLPEKLENSDQVSGSEPNEITNGITEVSMKEDVSQSDQWKMNVSGSDILPENQSSTSNISNIKDLSGVKFSSRVGKYGPETEDVEIKAEGSRLYRRETISRVGDLSTRDGFVTRGRFRVQVSSSNNADESIRDSGALRSSTRRGPQIPTSTWNRSPPFAGPSFRRSLHEDITPDDNLTNEININPNVTRQSFRTRLPPNRDEDEFRARLGLRPTGDTCHNRFVNVGPRGRTLRYGSRNNDGGPRGRYYGPANDEYDESSMEYSHSFPIRRRCFSGSTSPQRSRTRSPINGGFRRRSRSPNFRPDTRIRRPRSPDYGHGFEPNLEPNSRWVKYKPRSTSFDRRSPPPIGERLGFHDSLRKTKQSENFRSGPSGRFPDEGRGGPGPRYLGNDDELPGNGFRRGGFVRRYDMDRPVKRIQYDDEDGYGPVYDSRDKEGLEFHRRGNGNGTESRFRDLPRRPRDERENW